MLKDLRDMKGDSQVYGRDFNYCKDKRFVIIARVLIVVGSLITLLPFVLGYCKYIYLVASIVAIALAIASIFNKPTVAIRYVYTEIFIITAGSMVDMLVFGP